MNNMTSLVQTRSNLPATNTPRVNIIAALAFLSPVALGTLTTILTANPIGAVVGLILGLLAAQSPKIARQWERGVGGERAGHERRFQHALHFGEWFSVSHEPQHDLRLLRFQTRQVGRHRQAPLHEGQIHFAIAHHFRCFA